VEYHCHVIDIGGIVESGEVVMALMT